MVIYAILFLLPLFTSLILSRVIIQFWGRRLLDTPNTRSSHQIPTPRGGGIALACGTILTLIVAIQLEFMSGNTVWWLTPLAALMALLGACDDLFNLNIGVRLAVQIALSSAGVFLAGGYDAWPPQIQPLLILIAILCVAWATNLYNFMDGINGLAALEAISVALSMAYIYWLSVGHADVVYILIVIASAACGFLFWNFPSAKLFMGDSGSLFIGFSFGLLMVSSANFNLQLFFAWLILLAVFISDASYTLAYRIITKQAFQQAHRTHAYQKMAIKLNSHTRTTAMIIAINIFWLMPIAMAVSGMYIHELTGLLVAYAPLVFLVHKLKAGRAD